MMLVTTWASGKLKEGYILMIKKIANRWASYWRERQDLRKEKIKLVKKITQLQDIVDDQQQTIESERLSRSSERDQRIDRERLLNQQVRELEETVAVNKITIENLNYETTRNRERLKAELAMHISERKSYLEGESRELS